jgi:Peptidase A4 family
MQLRPRRLLASSVASVTIALGLGGLGSGSVAAANNVAVLHPLVQVSGVHENTVQSDNWSGYDEGYLDTGALATSISGEWTVPTATQHTSGQAEDAANWVGIGGGCVNMKDGCTVTDETLIQAGTEEDVSSSGAATYSAWWEALPAPSFTASVTVNPGDLVSVSISGPGAWKIVFDDLTNGQSFTETLPYSSTEDSAEWVEEAPVVVSTSGSTGEASLPSLTSPHFDEATLNGDNPALTPAYEMQMVSSSGTVDATPSAPDPDANGFNVCTYADTCTAPSD